MNNSKAHQDLVHQIMLEVGSLPQVRIWKRQVGLARWNFSDRLVHIGVKGESDLQGIIQGGQFLAIEVKTGVGKLSADQRRWRAMVIKFGGAYIEARDLNSCLQSVKLLLR